MKPSHLTLLSIALVALFLSGTPTISSGQVYRWVDQGGAIHFTDNPQNIPVQYRNNAMEFTPPPITTYAEERGQRVGAVPQSGFTQGANRERPLDSAKALEESIQTMKSQIQAKRDLIRYVDERKNLAVNPYRNRIIMKNELELYDRYQQEIPEDERELERLESALRDIQKE